MRKIIYNLVDIKNDSKINKHTNLLLYLIHSEHNIALKISRITIDFYKCYGNVIFVSFNYATNK